MDKSVPRGHCLASLGTDLSIRNTHSCQILISNLTHWLYIMARDLDVN